ncbi:hypothetical protein [uncultured Ferrovibrio sp.]|jgi:hypothetical protein|uniref:hypothetical protein n=1 Tax=uncultured Ferrovibrio sp. TaxID=1576913 RepID=UPI00260CFE2F|nr:hypothetical protein [uncultured Ferrovibrio sp.]
MVAVGAAFAATGRRRVAVGTVSVNAGGADFAAAFFAVARLVLIVRRIVSHPKEILSLGLTN